MSEHYSRSNDDSPEDSFEKMMRRMMGGTGADGNEDNAVPGADSTDPAGGEGLFDLGEMGDALAAMGINLQDPTQMGLLQAQIKSMFSGDSPPFDEQVARNAAQQAAVSAGDPEVSEQVDSNTLETVQLANLWLSEVTNWANPHTAVYAHSRTDWVNESFAVWSSLVSPVARGVVDAVTAALSEQIAGLDMQSMIDQQQLPPQFAEAMQHMSAADMQAQIAPVMRKTASSMFSLHVGTAIGDLAQKTLTGSEVGIPVLGTDSISILPSNIHDFATGLTVDSGIVALYLSMRESARVLLFQNVSWLGPALIAAIQRYASDITVDTQAIEQQISQVDPSDTQALQEALAGSLFAEQTSPAQKQAMTRLATLLALIEGWVDVVVEQATHRLPDAPALAEAVSRRRASGGPTARLFASLMGLDLRPKRWRDAAELFRRVQEKGGQEARDSVWAHPHHVPEAADLDHPDAFVARLLEPSENSAAGSDLDDVDMALQALLDQGAAELASEQEKAADTRDADEGENGSGESLTDT